MLVADIKSLSVPSANLLSWSLLGSLATTSSSKEESLGSLSSSLRSLKLFPLLKKLITACRFGIEVSDDVVEALKTPKDLINFLDKEASWTTCPFMLKK